jgi:hypothetical protein
MLSPERPAAKIRVFMSVTVARTGVDVNPDGTGLAAFAPHREPPGWRH